jgi:hypothetical protein
MVIFARNRKLFLFLLRPRRSSKATSVKAKSVRWEQMDHGASVPKSTVFALTMRGQFKKPAVLTVRRGVCHV